ncbi:hypothetical protein BGZ96_003334 [Linnemannia gamsii]|uniref:Uncharacterized protein n=1 Tax=Linnemannia gamsii TaxID=64522 RepID=A0ABQ7JJF7_9FUNG|nr:hypothetical protein BGZ96_003334 [Linnemannia gamsii]
MSFEDIAEQIAAVTEALERIKNLQPEVQIHDNSGSKSTSSWSSSPISKAPRQSHVPDLPPLEANQHPIVLSIWVNSHSLTSYKSNLARELMDLIREKRKHAQSLELARINNKNTSIQPITT